MRAKEFITQSTIAAGGIVGKDGAIGGQAPALEIDNPGGDWLQYEIENSVESGTDKFGAPGRFGSVTASFSAPVLISVNSLMNVPGRTGEQQNVRQDDLKSLKDYMQQNGHLPLNSSKNKEYSPFITVDLNGKPWMSEGNHRVMAAAALGWEYLPVVVRYFSGGEQKATGNWKPSNLLAMDRVTRGTPRYQIREGVNDEGEVVQIPMGRSSNAKVSVPRYWYHTLNGRKFEPNGNIRGYSLPPHERELSDNFPKGMTSPEDRFVYIDPSPRNNSEIIDISTIADRIRQTGQGQGYAIVHGDIPAIAIVGHHALHENQVDKQKVHLSTLAPTWYVHFFKEIAHGQAIINSGIITPGSDDIVWAIRQGKGYNASQIETDYDTGEHVPRAGAIVFAPFDRPYLPDLHGLAAWQGPVECSSAFLVDVATGKSVCNNTDKVSFIKSFEYGNNQ